MGLVMFARYGEDSPLDKGYVQTNDQVRVSMALFYLFFSPVALFQDVSFSCAHGLFMSQELSEKFSFESSYNNLVYNLHIITLQFDSCPLSCLSIFKWYKNKIKLKKGKL